MQDRPTAPPRERAYERAHERVYERLYDRIDRLEERLEDAISHFYNAINELRERVSTLEKKHH
jgi:exonuclease VII small subunit